MLGRFVLTLVGGLATFTVIAADKELIPTQLTQLQRDNLLRFLEKHEKPNRYVPADAKVVDAPPASVDTKIESTPERPIKQYMVQITPHRPVPGQEEVKQVDVFYYRPNPEGGKPGITVRHTVDVTTGTQVGPTEVFVKRHTPVSREELTEAVKLAREKSGSVQELYKLQTADPVRWEYLQLMIGKKHDPHEPGDRVVRLVFTAPAAEGQAPPAPVRVVVNLTKNAVVAEGR